MAGLCEDGNETLGALKAICNAAERTDAAPAEGFDGLISIQREKFAPVPGLNPGPPVLRTGCSTTELCQGSIHSPRATEPKEKDSIQCCGLSLGIAQW
ncbi:hypothetical protein ANN_12585 [Periplaneta americana]|uniref:Uncharacterized protein n=1 Tax=Periplaneta americana TaxID=6978 RepID=A0ABQ8TH18_PERAM|nr:hypothetical protein ANN_12585 [Periplaneta americana]